MTPAMVFNLLSLGLLCLVIASCNGQSSDGPCDCLNGGLCTSESVFDCLCPAGYTGQRCEIASCSENDFQCFGNGRCIPYELKCNNIPDCSDESDENRCPQIDDLNCQRLYNFDGLMQANCVNNIGLPKTLVAGVDFWMYTTPLNSSGYIVSVEISHGFLLESGSGISPGPLEVYEATIVTSSGQSFNFTAEPGSGTTRGETGIGHFVEPGDEVMLTLKYTPDIFNEPFQIVPFNPDCFECVRVSYVHLKYPDCTGNGFATCVAYFSEWDMLEEQNPQCQPWPYSEEFRSLITPCLDTVPPVQEEAGLSIYGCPDKISVVAPTSAPVAVFFDAPVALDPGGMTVNAESDFFPGAMFSLGDTTVTYGFFYEGNEGPVECSFIVSVELVSCGNGQFRCNTGECIPSEYVCDQHSDCSDGSDVDEWKEDKNGLCSVNGDTCADAVQLVSNLTEACFTVNSPRPNFVDYRRQAAGMNPWNFTVYENHAYIIGVYLDIVNIAGIFELDLEAATAPAFYINFKSSQHEERLQYAFQPPPPKGSFEDLQPPGLQPALRSFRVALPLQDKDNITVHLSYTPDFISNLDPVPISNDVADCYACVGIQVAVPQIYNDDCNPDPAQCLLRFYEFNEGVRRQEQCVIKEWIEEFRNLWQDCTDANNIYEKDSIFVLGCPSDFSVRVPEGGGSVYIQEPQFFSASGERAYPETPYFYGKSFEPGENIVGYGYGKGSTLCEFTVTIEEVMCPSTKFQCGNGRCMSKEFECDFVDDCGDQSDEDNCQEETASCGHLRQRVKEAFKFVDEYNQDNGACPQPEPEPLSLSRDFDAQFGGDDSEPTNEVIFNVPIEISDIYLWQIQLFSEIPPGRFAFQFNVKTTKSNQSATAYLIPRSFNFDEQPRSKRQANNDYISAGVSEGYLRSPIKLRRGEQVVIQAFATTDYLNDDFTPYYDGFFPRTLTFMPDCADGFTSSSNCLPSVAKFREAVRSEPQELIDMCLRQEEQNIYKDLYAECFSAPKYEFIESTQRGEGGSYVNLRCIASGTPPPLVQWIRTRDNVVIGNSTNGALGVTVRVPLKASVDEKYNCTIQNYLGNRSEEVIVGQYSSKCQTNVNTREDYFKNNAVCSLQQEIMSSNFMPPGRLIFFIRSTPNGYIHSVTIIGDSIRGVRSIPSLATVDLILRNHIIPQRRRKREIDQIYYARQYNHVFLKPDFGNVTFELDPPVYVRDFDQASFAVDMVLIGFPNLDLPKNLQAKVHYTSCPPNPLDGADGDPARKTDGPTDGDARKKRQSLAQPLPNLLACRPLYSNVTDLEREASREECGYVDERYKVLQLCLSEAIAEPKVVVQPRSRLAVLEDVSRLNCYIRNAIKYRWEKVNLNIVNPTVSGLTSNTLLFNNFQPTDQGAYKCIGYGGGEYMDMVVESQTAVVVARGVSSFLVTLTIPEPNYGASELLQEEIDPSNWFGILYEVGVGDAQFRGAESRNYRKGSLILETLLYFENANNDTELAMMLETTLQNILDRASYGLYNLGYVDVESITVENIGSCPGEVTQERGGNVLTWRDTPVNSEAESVEKCPSYSAQGADTPRAVRKCSGDMISAPMWEDRVVNDCFEGEDATDQLDLLAETEVTNDNVADIATDVAVLSNDTTIGGDGLVDLSIAIENIANVGDDSDGVSLSIVKAIDNILDFREEEFIESLEEDAPSRITRSLEMQISNLQKRGGNFTEIRRNLGVRTVQLPMSAKSFQQGLGFASLDFEGAASDRDLEADDTKIVEDRSAVNFDDVEAYIGLPDEALDQSTFVQGMVPISFFIYQNSKLFQSKRIIEESLASEGTDDEYRRIVGSRVIAATVEGSDVQGLVDPVVSAFEIVQEMENEEIRATQCVYWDYELDNGKGDWSDKGCELVQVPGTDRTVCHCDHLTSFAVIVDIHGQKNASLALDLISKIGVAISIAALVLTIITYLAIKKLRKAQPQRILLSLCFALLGLYIVFLAGIELTSSRIGCLIVAILLHYFTLASLMWMAVEAVNMYMLFVRVLDAHIHKFLLKASIVAWGIPLIVVVVAAAMDHTVYENEDHCFMRVGNLFYFGQLLLIGLILLFNLVVFVIVNYKLTCGRRQSHLSDKQKKQETIKRLQNAVIISVLLGLTWVSAFFVIIDDANFAFQIIFCVLNSLQGVFIFLLFCVRQNEVRRAWQAWCCCRRYDDRRKSSGAPVSSSAGTGTGTGTRSTGGGYYSGASHVNSDYSQSDSHIPMNDRPVYDNKGKYAAVADDNGHNNGGYVDNGQGQSEINPYDNSAYGNNYN